MEVRGHCVRVFGCAVGDGGEGRRGLRGEALGSARERGLKTSKVAALSFSFLKFPFWFLIFHSRQHQKISIAPENISKNK